MEAFRFLHRDHLGLLLNGEIRFGRLRYYQLLEHAYGDVWIGDAEEGRQLTMVDATVDLSDPNDQNAARLKAVGAIRGSGSIVRIVNGRIVGNLDCFVLSCSAGALAELVVAMTKGEAGWGRYDACVRIKGIRCLAHALWTDGRLCDGRKVRDVFQRPLSGRVAYESSGNSLQDGPIPAPSPFKKRAFYAAQREVRIVLVPHDPIEQDHITITSVGAVQLLEATSIDVASVKVEHAESMTPDAALQGLLGIVEEWNELERIRMRADDARHGAASPTVPAKRREVSDAQSRQVDEAREAFRRQHGRDLVRMYFELRRYGFGDPSIDRAIVGEAAIWVVMAKLSPWLDQLLRERPSG